MPTINDPFGNVLDVFFFMYLSDHHCGLLALTQII